MDFFNVGAENYAESAKWASCRVVRVITFTQPNTEENSTNISTIHDDEIKI